MEYQTILTIKESEKATVELAAVELLVGPVIVKRLKGGNPEIYRLLSLQKNVHIPQIYVVEEQNGELLIAEEYIDGESLSEHLQKNLLSDEQKLNYALQLCEAVGFLHALKPSVIHRDIKPSNILINEKGELKLIDFDASRHYKESPSSSDTRLLGTVEYAPPEQFGYSQTDVRSDTYSMGVVFHEMKPTENKKLAEKWEKIAEKCTSFDPKNRYQSVAELARELEKLVVWKKNRKIKLAAWIGGLAAMLVIVAIIVVLWPKQRQLTDGSSVSAGNTPIPTTALTMTPMPSPSLTPTETPTPTLTPSPSPAPTSTPIPSMTPTITPVPTMTEKMKMLTNYLVTPSEVSSSSCNYYKSAAEQVELVYTCDVVGLEVTFLGGMCYKYATKEYIYIPPEMIEGGPTYYKVADEFVLGLEPGMYQFYVARETETGRMGFMGSSAEIHSEESSVQTPQKRLIETSRTFYSDYQRNVDFVVLCAVTSRISGLCWTDSDSEYESVDASCYDIALDGKVLLIKKEFLAQHLNEESLHFTVVFDDGCSEEIEVKLINGSHPRISPTPIPSVTPTPTPDPLALPTSINQHYYKGLTKETELILRHGSDTALRPETWEAECYDYYTGITYHIPMEEIEIGPGYIRFLDEGLEQLEASLYKLTVNMYYANSRRQSTSRVLKVYAEEERLINHKQAMATSTNYFYKNNPHDFLKDILSTFPGVFTGVWMESEEGQQVEIASEWYTMYCENKVLVLKKEFLQQYYEEGKQFKLIYHFDNGGQQTVVINFKEDQ